MDPKSPLISLLPAAKGVNTRAEETNLPEQSLREAVNVTLDNAGKLRRRAGYTSVLALTDAHSLFAVGDLMLCVTDGALTRVNPTTYATTTVRAGIGLEPLSYAVVNDWVFYGNPSVQGRINAYDPTQHYSTWGVPMPGLPSLSAGAGNLQAGQYQVTVTWVDASGQESGAMAPAVITLSAPGGIQLDSLPQGAATYIRIYASTLDGTELHRQVQVPMGTTAYTLTQLVRGKPCKTVFLEPMPLGHAVRYHAGRVWVATENLVYYSQPLYYGLHAPDDDYLPPFPAEVTVMEPVDDGLFIVADRTYFLRGTDPKEFTLSRVDDARGVKGSSLQVRAQLINPEATGTAAYWFDVDGPVIGLTGGQVTHSTLDALPGITSSFGASGILRDGGVDRVVTSLAGPSDRSGFRATDSATIEIIRSSSL